MQSISFKDCLAEGIVHSPEWQELGNIYKPPESLHPDDLSNEEADKEIGRGWEAYAVQAYAKLWDSTHPTHKWETNPFVFTYSFKLLPGETER